MLSAVWFLIQNGNNIKYQWIIVSMNTRVTFFQDLKLLLVNLKFVQNNFQHHLTSLILTPQILYLQHVWYSLKYLVLR